MELRLHSSFHLYADDLQIYAEARLEDVDSAMGTMNWLLNGQRITDKFPVFFQVANHHDWQSLFHLELIVQVESEVLPNLVLNDTE